MTEAHTTYATSSARSTDYRPAVVFPPGDLLNDELRERGWTAEQFADLSGLTLGQVLTVLGAEGRISVVVAERLSRTLGTSPDLWLNLDRSWRTWRSRGVPDGRTWAAS